MSSGNLKAGPAGISKTLRLRTASECFRYPFPPVVYCRPNKIRAHIAVRGGCRRSASS